MKKGVLLLNGDAPSTKTIKNIDGDFIVCCDGAYDYARCLKRIDLLVGDLDSVKTKIREGQAVKRYSAEKDYTDGHLGLEELLSRNCDTVEIYGGLGKRFDHQLANLSLLYRALIKGADAVMIDNDCSVRLYNKSFRIAAPIDSVVSLVPFSDRVHILYTKGLKYPIEDKFLDKSHILGISNEAAAESFEVGLIEGVLTVIVSAR